MIYRIVATWAACIGLTLLCDCSGLLPGPFGDPATPDGGADLGPMTAHLLISPSTAETFVLTGTMPVTQSFKAYRVDEQTGQQTDVTSTCFWEIVQTNGQVLSLGTITQQGLFTSATEAAGSGSVQATYGSLQASVPIVVQLNANHLSTADDNSAPPQNAPTYFGGSASGPTPSLVYPQSGSVIPQNLNQLEFQWLVQGTNLQQVTLSGVFLNLKIYTTSPRRLSLTAEEYNLLTDAGLYGPITVSMRAVNTNAPTQYGQSSSIQLTVAPPLVGASYYFSTATPGRGIWRYDWNSEVRGTTAQGYATDQTVAFTSCIGCHALSKDGATLSASTSMTSLAAGMVFDVNNGGEENLQDGALWTYSSVSAAGDLVALAGGNAISLLTTGPGAINPVLNGRTGQLLTQPSLSSDSKLLVFVQGEPVGGQSEVHVQNGSLQVLAQQGGSFTGPAQTLLAAANGSQNNYYPALTPPDATNGQWVLFNRAASDSYNNPAADLWVIAADGSGAPIHLQNASAGFATANAAVTASPSNSYPQVAPIPVTINGDTVYYFTFSSRRDYGVEITRTGANQSAGGSVVLNTAGGQTGLTGWNNQIWLSTFDPKKAKQGMDPSTAAIWLPMQSPLSSNHTATFTQSQVGSAL